MLEGKSSKEVKVISMNRALRILICVISIPLMIGWIYFLGKGSGYNKAVFGLLGLAGIGAAFYNVIRGICFSKKKLLFSIAASLIFAICGILAGYVLTYGEPLMVVFTSCVIFAGGFFIILNLSFAVPALINRAVWFDNDIESRKLKPALLFIMCTVFSFLVFLFYFLTAVNPANLSTDSFNQISQIMGDRVYSNHHPYFHTQLIHIFVWIGFKLFDDLDTGIAMYVLFQMLCLAMIFAYAVTTLYEYGIKLRWIILIMAWYTLLPYNINISTVVWKDILFGVVALWTVIESFRLMNNVGGKRPLHFVLLWISGVGSCIFRNNGFLAYLFTVFLIMLWTRRKYWKIGLVYLIILISGWIIKKPVLKSLGVENDNLAAISIQVQQMCRTVKDGGELTEKEADVLNHVIGIDFIKSEYKPHRSLYVMRSVRKSKHLKYYKSHKSDFNKAWLSLGKRYPRIYINAWVDMTRGYWYPGGVDDNNGMPYEEIKENKYSVTRKTGDTAISKFWRKYIELPKTSYLMFTVDIALYVWILVLATWYAMYKKEGDALIAFFAVSVVLSLLPTSPIWNCFRYSYAMFTVTPFCITYIAARGSGQKRRRDLEKKGNIL